MDGMEDLKNKLNPQSDVEAESVAQKKPLVDSKGRAYATGKRKTAIAKVWLQYGKGNVTVNNKGFDEYFPLESLRAIAMIPFGVTNTNGSYDVSVTLFGGGVAAQADALKHGISKALCNMDPFLRPALKIAGLLTRDSRKVERKKYGKKKARKSFQFSKR